MRKNADARCNTLTVREAGGVSEAGNGRAGNDAGDMGAVTTGCVVIAGAVTGRTTGIGHATDDAAGQVGMGQIDTGVHHRPSHAIPVVANAGKPGQVAELRHIARAVISGQDLGRNFVIQNRVRAGVFQPYDLRQLRQFGQGDRVGFDPRVEELLVGLCRAVVQHCGTGATQGSEHAIYVAIVVEKHADVADHSVALGEVRADLPIGQVFALPAHLWHLRDALGGGAIGPHQIGVVGVVLQWFQTRFAQACQPVTLDRVVELDQAQPAPVRCTAIGRDLAGNLLGRIKPLTAEADDTAALEAADARRDGAVCCECIRDGRDQAGTANGDTYGGRKPG